MQKNIFITGEPKSGKSTLLDRVVLGVSEKVGITTKEILANDRRTGFEMQTSKGNKAPLASLDFETPYHVSKYAVKVENLESLIPEVFLFKDSDLLYLDEIGQMQLFSEKFKNLVLRYVDSSNTLIATISQVYEDEFIKILNKREDIIWVELSQENRMLKERFITMLIKKIDKAKRYITQPERFIHKDSGIEMQSDHATRNLIFSNGLWRCDCDFFKEYSICSHSIATTETQKPKTH